MRKYFLYEHLQSNTWKCFRNTQNSMQSIEDRRVIFMDQLQMLQSTKREYSMLGQNCIPIQNITQDSSFDWELLRCRLISIFSKCIFTSHWPDHKKSQSASATR